MKFVSCVLSLICLLFPGVAAATSGFTHLVNPVGSTNAKHVAVNPDGTIVIAGTILTTNPDTKVSSYDSFVLKLKADGSPDAQFGVAGWIRMRHFMKRVSVLDDGSILVGASSDDVTPGDTGFYLGKFTRNGHPDQSFSVNGQMITDFSPGEDPVDGMVVHSSGKISLIGIASAKFAPDSAKFLEMVRMTSDGKLDSSFGTNGKIRLQAPWTNLKLHGAFKRRRGGYLLLCEDEAWSNGGLGSSGTYFFVALDTKGNPDLGYGQGGKLRITNIGKAIVGDALQLGDGSIILTGSKTPHGSVGSAGFIAKLTPECDPDLAFGVGGLVETPIRGRALAIDSDGKLYVSGIGSKAGNSLGIAKFSATGVPDTAFGQGGVVQEGVVRGAASGWLSTLAVSPGTGKLVVAAVIYPKANDPGPDRNDTELLIARFTPKGVLDLATFGAGDIASNEPKLSDQTSVSVPAVESEHERKAVSGRGSPPLQGERAIIADKVTKHPEIQRPGPIPARFVGTWVARGENSEFLVITSSALMRWSGTATDAHETVQRSGAFRVVKDEIRFYSEPVPYMKPESAVKWLTTRLTTRLKLEGDDLIEEQEDKTLPPPFVGDQLVQMAQGVEIAQEVLSSGRMSTPHIVVSGSRTTYKRLNE